MLPAFQRSAPPPIRLMYVYAPTGMIPTAWYPSTTGSDFEFSRIMKPLEKFRKDVLVVSGLGDNPGRSLGDGPGDHSRAVASYLTGVHPKKTEGTDIRCG
ncbi:MAG TPA: DUF1552 domain-containing protein, partial [Bryobacteraceae bacterium]|nr:DUF1552 domain-containing protein [Bryobacteraceae bacterium]